MFCYTVNILIKKKQFQFQTENSSTRLETLNLRPHCTEASLCQRSYVVASSSSVICVTLINIVKFNIISLIKKISITLLLAYKMIVWASIFLYHTRCDGCSITLTAKVQLVVYFDLSQHCLLFPADYILKTYKVCFV